MSVDYVKANDDIVQDTKDLLLSQFVNSPNINKFAEIIATEADSYEKAAEGIFTAFLLNEATGFALDSIGEFLNIPRGGKSDESYRLALIISAIGSNSEVTRDSLYNLVDIMTGGLGGYFYKGRYHDLYIYLQDSCIDKEVVGEFFNKYLPLNTQASILIESGLSFGFEGNDQALGFDQVWRSSTEGDLYIGVPLTDVNGVVDKTLPRAFEFRSPAGNLYRTEYEYEMDEGIAAATWIIPEGYVAGDRLSVSLRNSNSGSAVTGRVTVQSTLDSQREISEFLSRVVIENGVCAPENVYTDDSTWTVYLGYVEQEDTAVFSSRASAATTLFSLNIMKNVASNVAREHNDGDTGTSYGFLYEQPSINYIEGGNNISDTDGLWVLTSATATRTTESSIHVSYDANTYTSDSDVLLTTDVTIPDDGLHTFSVFFKSSTGTLQQFLKIGTNTLTFTDNNPLYTIDGDDFDRVAFERYGLWLRVEVTKYLTAGTHTLSVGTSVVSGTQNFTVFGAQMEPWGESSSYIPTLGSVVYRAQDFLNTPSTPSISGFTFPQDINATGKDLSGFTLQKLAHVIGRERGGIVVNDGEVFIQESSTPFDILQATAGEFQTGIGVAGWMEDDSHSSPAGSFCSRLSLTSRDILGFTSGSDEDTVDSYQLDAKYAEILSWLPDAVPSNVIIPFQKFRPHDWNVNELGTTTSSAFSSEGIKSYIEVAEILTGGVTNFNTSDITYPDRPYYYEVDLDKLPNASSIFDTIFRATNVRVIDNEYVNESGDTETEREGGGFTFAINVSVDPGVYALSISIAEASGRSVFNDEMVEIGTPSAYQRMSEFSYTYTDAVIEGSKTVGILYKPLEKTFKMYINGVAYNGGTEDDDAYMKYTHVGSQDTSGAVIGDRFKSSPYFNNSAVLSMEFIIDNTEPEPATVDDYGTMELLTKGSELKYTSQLNEGVVDIFGKPIKLD